MCRRQDNKIADDYALIEFGIDHISQQRITKRITPKFCFEIVKLKQQQKKAKRSKRSNHESIFERASWMRSVTHSWSNPFRRNWHVVRVRFGCCRVRMVKMMIGHRVRMVVIRVVVGGGKFNRWFQRSVASAVIPSMQQMMRRGRRRNRAAQLIQSGRFGQRILDHRVGCVRTRQTTFRAGRGDAIADRRHR